MSWIRLSMQLAVRSVLKPRLGMDLLRVAWRFRDRRWYRKAPFLPLPARSYMRWRMYTAYGNEEAVPPAEDVISFATWLRTQP